MKSDICEGVSKTFENPDNISHNMTCGSVKLKSHHRSKLQYMMALQKVRIPIIVFL